MKTSSRLLPPIAVLFLLASCRTPLPTPPDCKPEVTVVRDTATGLSDAADKLKKDIAAARESILSGNAKKASESLLEIEGVVSQAEPAARRLSDTSDSLEEKSAKTADLQAGFQKMIDDLQKQLKDLQEKYASEIASLTEQRAKEKEKMQKDFRSSEEAMKKAHARELEESEAALRSQIESMTASQAKLEKDLEKWKNKHTTWIFSALIVAGSLALAASLALAVYVSPKAGAMAAIGGVSMVGTGWALQSYADLLGKIAMWTMCGSLVISAIIFIWIIVRKQKALKEVVDGYEHCKEEMGEELKEKLSKVMKTAQSLTTELEVAGLRSSSSKKREER